MTSNILHDLIKNSAMSRRGLRKNRSSQHLGRESSGMASVLEMNCPAHLQLMPYDECVQRLMFHEVECRESDIGSSQENICLSESIARLPHNRYLDSIKDSSESGVTGGVSSDLKQLKCTVEQFRYRQQAPFLVYPGLVKCDFIQRCLHVRFSKSSAPLQVIEDIHVAIISRCESAVRKHKSGNQEHYQYELMIALRAIYELKSAIPKARSGSEKKLYYIYHSLFQSLNEQLDFCSIKQVLAIIIAFRVLTKCWGNLAQRHQIRKSAQNNNLQTHYYDTYKGPLIKHFFTSGHYSYASTRSARPVI